MSYVGRMTGAYDGDRYVSLTAVNEAMRLWGKAGNAVQWLP